MILRGLPYILVLITVLSPAAPANAKSLTENFYWARNPFARDRNPYRPRTSYGVYKAYQSLVFRKDGIDLAEARIISQYHLLEAHRQQAFDFRKPRLVGQTDEYYAIRFPGKYSVMFKKVNIFIYHVSKADGAILDSYAQDVPAAAPQN